MQNDCAIYQVGLKILLRNGTEVLILRDAQTGYIDLPGGRINILEKDTPIAEILQREIQEELGKSMKYSLGKPVFQFRRFIPGRDVGIFITVYEGSYVSGDIVLSDEHAAFEWVNPKILKITDKDFGSREEFTSMNNYFEQ